MFTFFNAGKDDAVGHTVIHGTGIGGAAAGKGFMLRITRRFNIAIHELFDDRRIKGQIDRFQPVKFMIGKAVFSRFLRNGFNRLFLWIGHGKAHIDGQILLFP